VNPAAPQPIILTVEPGLSVSGIFERPDRARAAFVMAHGAGAGMSHAFLADVSGALSERGIACLRYQFPFMERGQKRPDASGLCHSTVRAAVAWALRAEPRLPLFAGGKSFGGRMTSQAQAIEPLSGVRGLAFLGFPLHPPKKPSVARADHLATIRIPMIFLQGTRDALAQSSLMMKTIERLGAGSTVIEAADHGFHVPARSGRTDADVLREVADALERWIDAALV
jgi:predicted alpha/beta-hydrolase family hydrolase